MAQINKPDEYFNTELYTGNGTTGHAITGVGFQPDWVWIKNRGSAGDHALHDAIRGATNRLKSNTTDAEATVLEGVQSFDSDGFTLGNAGNYNGSSGTYVSWNWLANGTGSSNTDGSITSTVSASTVSGFSIVSYTGNATAGATIGHGLGVVPKVIFYKNRDQVGDWSVYTEMVGNDRKLQLNLTSASTASAHYNSTTPTSSVFTVGSSERTNGSGDSIIAYCFAEKKGFSKFGSYTGNGNANGAFVYTGFKPAFIMVKRSDSTSNWGMWDTKRNTFNVSNSIQRADTSDAEVTLSPNNDIDILSNSFKVRSTTGLLNTSGGTYIYMAFAENPLVGTNNIPATAR